MEVNHLRRVRTLYKVIMKLHKGLPQDLQLLGNNYTRDEFKRHKKCSERESIVFMTEWTHYALNLADQLGLKGIQKAASIGKHLDQNLIDKMSDEQVRQLYELMISAQKDEIEDSSFEKNRTE